ncbi:MAG: TraX family protein [Lachnospiraceae bacterium]|nr:TraX family protein [Lachnospiraceae bacterium]
MNNRITIQSYSSRRGRKGPSFARSSRRGRPGISGSGLKLLGAVLMLLDHICVAVIERGILKSGDPAQMQKILETAAGQNWWMADRILRSAGMLAFPIFAFLLAEGFVHTRHKRDYGLRLLVFALLSEIPFDLAIFGTWFYLDYQNVILTLFIAFLTLCGVQRFLRKSWMQLLCVLGGCGAAFLLRTDYGALGVLMVVVLYYARQTGMQNIFGAVMAFLQNGSIWGALAFIPISFYNGEKGLRPGKYFFYIFYPAHLLVLWLIRTLYLGA